ncbi:hypothetical protein JHK87_053289 [Glycine soja]|nr:hypothetical protein JHK87_053289 [Glycine soja]
MSALITPGLSAITAVIRVRVRVRVTYDIRNGSSQLLYDLDWRVREPGLFPAISDSSYQHEAGCARKCLDCWEVIRKSETQVPKKGEVTILSFDLIHSTSFDQATNVQEIEENVRNIDNSNTGE